MKSPLLAKFVFVLLYFCFLSLLYLGNSFSFHLEFLNFLTVIVPWNLNYYNSQPQVSKLMHSLYYVEVIMSFNLYIYMIVFLNVIYMVYRMSSEFHLETEEFRMRII